ncbi:MAG: FadR family transcriptional regulator [Deltaproteobacteria bacterium]|nr:FadR family transcriptional regulator [Deltaproteobacteria bacterium]
MVENTSRVDKITSDLRDQILCRKLTAGQKLPSERSLCSVFGVGRTTVREALKSLVVRGLVVRKGRGAIVADPENISPPAADLAELAVQVSIRQLYEVRKLLEVQTAGWAAQRATPEDIERFRRAIDPDGVKNGAPANPNRTFHDALVKAAHNPALEQVYESGRNLFFRLPFYWKHFDESEVKAVRARRHELAQRWHEHILAAIAQHDVAEAKGAMFQHLDIMEKDLLGRLQRKDPAPASRSFYAHPMLADYDGETVAARNAK